MENSNKDKEIKVSFCPNCKSRDVKYIFELKNMFGVLPKMRCGECGTEMPIFPILVINDKKLKTTVKSNNKKSIKEDNKK